MSQKEKCLNFRIYQIEKKALEIMCRNEKLKPSAMMRELIREGARNRGIFEIGLLTMAKENSQENQQPA
jgi:hypothetical protein